MKAVVFDIDGTLSDPTHRLHHVTNGNRRWDEFFAEMGDDGCHEDIKRLLIHFRESGHNGEYIVLCSGRPDDYREETVDWLLKHIGTDPYDASIPRWDALYMRPSGDTRPDYIVKRELLDRIRADGYEPWLVVDDRPTVVQMWRDAGLTCLQCRDWNEDRGVDDVKPAMLTLMVGPSGAGKTSWVWNQVGSGDWSASSIVSSDGIRADLCGDFRDQSKNDAVFAALHALVKARLDHGMSTVVDATNLKRRDRLANVSLQRPGGPVRYIVIDRPMEEKRRDAGWRAEVKDKDGQPFDLLAKHGQTFRSQLKDILAGDSLPNVTVVDLRRN